MKPIAARWRSRPPARDCRAPSCWRRACAGWQRGRSASRPPAARSVLSALLEDPLYQWRDVPVSLVRAAIAGWLDRFRDQRFSLTDAVSFELMRQERLTAAFAFDTDFVTAGFELLG